MFKTQHLYRALLQEQNSPSQRIYYLIGLSTDMLQNKHETLQVLNPFCMLVFQLMLLHNILQRRIIKKQNKFIIEQIVSPMLQCLDDNIELLIVRRVFLLAFIQFFTEISNWFVFLAEYGPNGYTNGFTTNLEKLVKIRQSQDLSFSDLPLQHLEDFLCCFSPMERLTCLFNSVQHRSADLTKIPYKLTIKTC